MSIEPKTEREKQSYLKGYNEAAAAFGGCKLCYGRGYSTTLAFAESEHERVKVPLVQFCSCERGTQLQKLWPNNAPRVEV